jgi:hypothetical protein
MDQKAIGWIDPSALLISLWCDPGRSFLLLTNEQTEKTKEKTNLNLLRGRLRGRAARFDVMYEFMSTRQDRLEVLCGQALMVSSEPKDSLRCANELLDWETQCMVHTSIPSTSATHSFSYGIIVLLGQKSRLSGGGHRSAAPHIPNAARS